MGFDPNFKPHQDEVNKTVNAICLEMEITKELVNGLYAQRRLPHVDEAIEILEAFLEVAGHD